ncbi:MAG: indolepyruvate oxidoreductase subunit beta [Dehalococcoidales bacterium]|nr:indolepyruvate oxidoreductase subunit beta [Dehalococcoidales bacterium]
MQLDFLLAGVGGQGIVLAGDLLAEAALSIGLDVKKSDVFGMAQRGGSVTSAIRIAQKVYSPLPSVGQADYLLATEELEAARNAVQLRPGGLAIVNEQRLLPLAVSSGKAAYPSTEEVRSAVAARAERLYWVPGEEMALALGNRRVVNVIMIGFLSHFLPLPAEAWETAITRRVPKRFLDLNREAFARGRGAAAEAARAPAGA